MWFCLLIGPWLIQRGSQILGWLWGRKERGNKFCSMFFLPWQSYLNTYQSDSTTHCYLELPFATDISLLISVSLIWILYLFLLFLKRKMLVNWFSLLLLFCLQPHNFHLIQMPLLCKIISRVDITLQNCPYFSLTYLSLFLWSSVLVQKDGFQHCIFLYVDYLNFETLHTNSQDCHTLWNFHPLSKFLGWEICVPVLSFLLY